MYYVDLGGKLGWKYVKERIVPEYFITFDRKPDCDTYVTGRALSKNAEAIDALCESHGLKAMNDWFSIAPADVAEFVDEGTELPAEVFYGADEGLVWLAAVTPVLQGSSLEDRDTIVAELADFSALMLLAGQQGCRWHLSVDI